MGSGPPRSSAGGARSDVTRRSQKSSMYLIRVRVRVRIRVS